MKVYIVFGTTGEYSDRSEWMVAAYTSEDNAKQHVLKATEHANAWQERRNSHELDALTWGEWYALEKSSNPLDPAFKMDNTGTTYCYAPVDVLDKFTYTEPIH
jgi:hypothetical protein